MKHRILVINPGSTSTKIAVFEGKEKLFDTTLRYSTEELASFGWVMEQVDFRRATIEKALADNNIDPDSKQDGIDMPAPANRSDRET